MKEIMHPANKISGPVSRSIELPEDEPPQTLEQQLRAAMYAAANYGSVTRIRCGHRTVYIIPEWDFEETV